MIEYLEQHNISDIKDLIHFLDNSFDGIVLSSSKGQILYVNQSLERITGVDPHYYIGKNPKEFKRDGIVLKVATKTSDNNRSDYIQILKGGKVCLITTVPVYFKDTMFYYSNYREINELANIQMELLEDTKNNSEYAFTEELKELLNIFSNKDVIIKSPVMIAIMKTISKIANTDVIINLSGESGVGKDVMAKFIHNISERKDQPFIQINCGSIPEHLLESELFGYTEGSFTGATKSGKQGLLEAAREGTIYLDEIGDLPLNLQVKLLLVMQNQEIYRIGSRRPIQLSARIICATNKNLEKMVKEGKFREDLYFRINMMPIYIPPLRERKEEIIHFCHHFLGKFNDKYHTNKVLSIPVCNKLENYNWPGNIREMRNLIERLILVSEGDKINIEHIPEHIVNKPTSKINHNEISTLKEMISTFEKDIINQSITKYGSRMAAEKLGIDYSTLKRKKRSLNQ